MSSECAFCFTNFKVCGTFNPSVPLFSATSNKEITSLLKKVHTDNITLCVLLSSIGIKLVKEKTNRISVCKKCARKVVNMYNTFNEICEAVKQNGTLFTDTPSTPPQNAKDKGQKRIQTFSPTGLSPHSKTTSMPMHDSPKAKNTRRRLNLRKSTLSVPDQGINANLELENTIANLMNLPVDENEKKSPPVVKVYVYTVFRVSCCFF